MENFDSVIEILLKIFYRDIRHFACVLDKNIEDIKRNLLITFTDELDKIKGKIFSSLEAFKADLHKIASQSSVFPDKRNLNLIQKKSAEIIRNNFRYIIDSNIDIWLKKE